MIPPRARVSPPEPHGTYRWRGAVALVAMCALPACDDPAVDGDASSSTTTSASGTFGCKLPFVGDAARPIGLSLVTRGADPVSTDLVDGAMAPMILPPQGGRVILVGVRASNIDPCGVEISGAIRDKVTSQVRVDQRTTNLRPSADGTLAESVPEDFSTYANIPTCPNQWASTDIQGNSFEVTVSVTDRLGRTASQTLNAVPFCAEPENEAECLCKCQQGYELGQACP